MSADIEVEDHVTSIEVTCGNMTDLPAVIASIRNQDSLLILDCQVCHDPGLAPVPYTGRNTMRKLLKLQNVKFDSYNCMGILKFIIDNTTLVV